MKHEPNVLRIRRHFKEQHYVLEGARNMKDVRQIDARFLNSMMAGMADILFKWDGGVYSLMGYKVGREFLDIIGKKLDFKNQSAHDILEELCKQLVETYRIADSINVSENRERECVELQAENCILLPFARREAERNSFFKRVPLCPIKNMIMDVLEKKGKTTEVRAFDIREGLCSIVIGVIEELPMEKELRENERRDD
jgi:hypothetical protein